MFIYLYLADSSEMDVDTSMDMHSDSDQEDDLDSQRLNHVLLPRVLPQTRKDSYETGLDLLNQMVCDIQSLAEFYELPPKTVNFMLKLRQIHTNCTPQTVLSAINRLGPGDTFAMFMRYQDCGILFRVPPNETPNDVKNVIVAPFPGCLDPSEIYKHDSDIEVICL